MCLHHHPHQPGGLSTSTTTSDVLYLRTHAHPSHVPVGFIASDTQPSCLIARDRRPGITLRNCARDILRPRVKMAPHNIDVREPRKIKIVFKLYNILHTHRACTFIDLSSSSAIQLLYFRVNDDPENFSPLPINGSLSSVRFLILFAAVLEIYHDRILLSVVDDDDWKN